MEDIFVKLEKLVEEWENYECSSEDMSEHCIATEEAIWSCAEQLSDLIAELRLDE